MLNSCENSKIILINTLTFQTPLFDIVTPGTLLFATCF